MGFALTHSLRSLRSGELTVLRPTRKAGSALALKPSRRHQWGAPPALGVAAADSALGVAAADAALGAVAAADSGMS